MLGHVPVLETRVGRPDWRVCVQHLCRPTPAVFDQGWLEVGPASQMCERYVSQVYMYPYTPSPQCLTQQVMTKKGGAFSRLGGGKINQ